MFKKGLIVKKNLIKSIKEKEIQLAKLSEHADRSSVCSDLYNRVVLQKAILKKELDDLTKKNFKDNVRRIFPHKKILICDYFKK